MKRLDEQEFIDILKAGIRSFQTYMMKLTDFHGAPATTEYLLTADIARAFLEAGRPAKVETLYRSLVTPMNRDRDRPQTSFGRTRADITVADAGRFQAIVEVKISGTGQRLGLVRTDLNKIAGLMKALGPRSARSIRAAVVFQTSFASRVGQEAEHVETTLLLQKLDRVEQDLHAELATFASGDGEIGYELVRLLEPREAVTATQVFTEPDGSCELGQAGHVVQYHAVLLRSLRPVPEVDGFRQRFKLT